jgi:putative ABC transport system permease protein
MIRNYLKIAFRNLARNKAFSFINIFGLAVGLATCMLIMLYIFSETGYDTQHQGADRIYRIVGRGSTMTGELKDKPWAAVSAPTAWGLKADMPEVEEVTRLLKFPSFDKMLLKHEDGNVIKQFYEPNGYYVDSTFLRIFTYDFKYGNAATALDPPNSVVISEEVAGKLFGNENPIGKPITIGIPFGDFSYKVTGVFRTAGIKSHIPAHLFLSMRNGDIGGWVAQQTNYATNNIFHTYVRLKKGADPKAFEKKLAAFTERRAGVELKALGVSRQLFIQPVKDIYLHSDLDDEIAPNGNITYLYILGSIALFVLLIACINFMNLSTARSGKRAKEVGVRKVMGAEKGWLIGQFLGESIIMSCLALLLALLLTWAFLPLFNHLTGHRLQLFGQPDSWAWIAALAVCTGILSGLYPAFYLSSFNPATVLKGKLLNNFSATTIRKGLVIFQFMISICLILGAVIIGRQLNYLNDRDLGFSKKGQVLLPMQNKEVIKNYETLKIELLKTPGIRSVSCGSMYPGYENPEDMPFYSEGKTVHDVVDVRLAGIDDNYFETLGLTLLKGREFSKEFAGDSNSIVLNETALQQLGYTINTAIGKKVYWDFQGKHNTLQVVGVVRNFNFQSLYNTIKPFGFTNSSFLGNKYGFVIINPSTTGYAATLKNVERTWSKINPGVPFVYSFLDKDFQRNYEKDQRASGIVNYFTGIALLIACLGLFGLSAFTAEQRTKEIGIRKVLGASVIDVTRLLSRDFIGLVAIAILIASPLAWFGMNKWLESFAYKVPISWWMFVLAGLLAIMIALVTVSFQSIRAAIANPVKSLRSE